MARRSTPLPLTLVAVEDQEFERSPLSPKSPKTPRSPFRFTSSKKSQSESVQAPEPTQFRSTTLPTTVSLSSTPPQAPSDSRDGRSSRTNFFSNYKASKSSSKLQNSDVTRIAEDNSMSRDSERGVAPSKVSGAESIRSASSDRTIRRAGGPSRLDERTDSPIDSPPLSGGSGHGKKSKPKSFSLLSRSRSSRDFTGLHDLSSTDKVLEQSHSYSSSMMTAPLPSEDRSFRSMMNSTVRQRSEDRFPIGRRDRSTSKDGRRDIGKSDSRFQNKSNLQQSTSAGGHKFLSNLKSGASKGAGAIKTGLFGKGGRSGSSNERDTVDDMDYQLKVLNLPLVEQTRRTRISKRLEDSRDKTEFWMPAFPWRAIDYLNYKGSEVEGLYRVPGSNVEVRAWQRRFDEQLDIDLFERGDLFDINIIGSMLKAWLRELPDELFPKHTQERIRLECEAAGQAKVPQMLIDELSALPPFNYYLLFAITCHLSLLLAHSDKNKMNYKNLCICFQPCIRIDSFCFRFLVEEWRDCWKGCKTEQHYVEQEYMLFDSVPPSSAEGRSDAAVESHDDLDRTASSSGSSVDAAHTKKLAFAAENNSASNTRSTALTVQQDRTPARRGDEMRPLSPIKPLSPIGL